MRRANEKAFAVLLLLTGLAALWTLACRREPIKVTTFHFERSSAIAFVCFCDGGDGVREPAPMEDCTAQGDEMGCAPLALVLQTNRDEIGVVDLGREELVDVDVMVPFNTFPQTGRAPSDITVTPDGERVLVTHVGDNFVAVFMSRSFLGETLPTYETVPLPGPATSIAVSKATGMAYVALPEQGAVAIFAPADSTPTPVIVPLAGVVEPRPEEPVEEAGDESLMEEWVEDVKDASEVTEGEEEEASDAGEGPAELEELGGGDVSDAEVTPSDLPPEADVGNVAGPPAEGVVPWDVVVRETDDRTLLLVSCSGSGGVLIYDAHRIETDAEGALISRVLDGVAVKTVAVASTSSFGSFLYAINRDEGTIHVVDMETGIEVDTTGGNPLAPRGAIRLSGRANDLVVVDRQVAEVPGPTTFNGVFAFVVASDGMVYAVDVEDRNCVQDGGGKCPQHVLRNSREEGRFAPSWAGPPALFKNDTQVQYIGPLPPGYPQLDKFENTYFPDGVTPLYGVSFYPYDPWEGVSDPPDIRRAVTQQWSITFEGDLPYSGGVGGNVEDGGLFSDAGLPFCAVGVRVGDILVIDDPPTPMEGADCTLYPPPGEIEYKIVKVRQFDLQIEVPSGAVYPLPTEDCFPFAVRFHVRASGEWVVVGSTTGYLHDWDIDADGNCVDRNPPCTSWTQEGCTLLNGRISERQQWTFVNPYIKLRFLPDVPLVWAGTSFLFDARSGFVPLSVNAARLPVDIEYLPWDDKLYISDGGTDGLVVISLAVFGVSARFF